MKLRPHVLAFAEAMERKLRANDWKGGWDNDSARVLLVRVIEEISEVVPLVVEDSKPIVKLLIHVAADIEDANQRHSLNGARIRNEGADVANMMMMVADVCGGLKVLP